MKPLIDADLLVLDDLFLRRKIATESADELQAILHRRYSLATQLHHHHKSHH